MTSVTDADGAHDLDTAINLNLTTDVATGNLSALVLSGIDGTATYGFQVTDGSHATFVGGGNITSEGQDVILDVQGNTLWGFVNNGGGATTYDPLNGDRAVFKLDLTPSSGAFTFTLLDNIDHHPVASADNLEGIKALDLGGKLTVHDSADGETLAFNNVSVKIIDDIPVAQADTNTAKEGGNPSVNLVLIIDTSGSMDDPADGIDGHPSRLSIEKAALINLLTTANVNQVMTVQFNSDADHNTQGGNVWTDKASAIAYITGLTAHDSTDYDAALAEVTGHWGTGPTTADHTLAYFLSDGFPNENNGTGTDGIVGGEITAWETFLSNHGIETSFAVGIGTGIDQSALNPIAWPNTPGVEPNSIVITDASQLSATLAATLPVAAQGNVLTDGIDDAFGADGHGPGAGIVSITVKGHRWTPAIRITTRTM